MEMKDNTVEALEKENAKLKDEISRLTIDLHYYKKLAEGAKNE